MEQIIFNFTDSAACIPKIFAAGFLRYTNHFPYYPQLIKCQPKLQNGSPYYLRGVNFVENCFNFLYFLDEYLKNFQWKSLDSKCGKNVKMLPKLLHSIDCVEADINNTSVDMKLLFDRT